MTTAHTGRHRVMRDDGLVLSPAQKQALIFLIAEDVQFCKKLDIIMRKVEYLMNCPRHKVLTLMRNRGYYWDAKNCEWVITQQRDFSDPLNWD